MSGSPRNSHASPGSLVDSGAPVALVAHGLTKVFPSADASITVLNNVSLSVEAGESVAITGPSGSGKSTLLNILGTLDRPTSGQVRVRGVDPAALDDEALARFRNRAIGLVFQEHHLLPQCTALENVLIPTLAFRTHEPVHSRAVELLRRMGLEHRLDHFPSELSGGERQRTAIARALLQRPAIVLADEPTGNLDRAAAETVAELLFEAARDEGAALVLVTHGEALAEKADRWQVMRDGSLQPHLRIV